MAFINPFVTTLAAAIAIAGMFPSAASFCVQNQWTGPISAYIVPLNGQTYKGVIQPGSSGCCNWNDATCFDINNDFEPATGAINPNTATRPQTTQCSLVGFIINQGKDDVKAVTKKFNVTFYKTLFTTTWDAISFGRSLASLAKSPKKVLGLIQQFKDLDAAGQGKIVPPGENLIAAGCTAGGVLTYKSASDVVCVPPKGCQ